MNAVATLLATGLALHLRNRIALVYAYAMPLVFLGVFAVLYRHEAEPLIGHLGQWLTVTVLGSACFGLPTTLVSERERGWWRWFRLAPVPMPVVLGSALLLRAALVLGAAALQLLVARALGMPWPAHPLALLLALACVAWALLGLGLVIAALANTVPAVQALGQCLFLPMLVVGGVAVPLASLPAWAQQLAWFLPGAAAVEALQAAATGAGMAGDACAWLFAWGVAAVATGVALFRWDPQQRLSTRRGVAVLAAFVLAAVAIGASSSRGRHPSVAVAPATRVADGVHLPGVLQAPADAPWRQASWQVIHRDIDYAQLPPDDGIVTPIAPAGEEPAPEVINALAILRNGLDGWAPAQSRDPLERARALLRLAGAIDLLQSPMERHVPRLVLARLQRALSPDDLPRVLYWIALHPGTNAAALAGLGPLGLPDPGPDGRAVEQRACVYAVKLLRELDPQRR